MSKKITIELNERQARIVLSAVEQWFRIRMGQDYEVSDSLAFYGYKKDDKKFGEFDRRIDKRNALHEVMKAIFRIAWPPNGSPGEIDDDTNVASDLYSALRHALDTSEMRSRGPFQMSTEPLPKITITDEEGHGNE